MASSYEHLSLEERTFLEVGMLSGWSRRALARRLQRAPSTISREVTRNRAARARYSARSAQRVAQRRATWPRRRRKLLQRRLWNQVECLLRERWSPEQIAGRLRVQWRSNPERWVSHETIYRELYLLPRGELRKSLLACLRQARQKRRRRSRGEDRRGVIANMVSIHERPAEVESRQVPGHWEGDLLWGSRNASAVGTLVERTSRFLILAQMKTGGAPGALEAFSRKLNPVPPWLRKTLTYDRGKEMAAHEKLSRRLGIQVYFADPKSPWQRGTNENTNYLVREYLPKGIDLRAFDQRQLDRIARQLNDRPRKCLDFRTPKEAFQDILKQSVALEP